MALKSYIAIAVLAGCICMGGCSSGSGNQTEKEKARLQWAAARANVMCGLARQQFESGDMDNCAKTLDQATKLDPTNSQVHLLIARVHIEKGGLEEAERELLFVRQADPKCAESYYLSGVICQRWQKQQAAYEMYSKASEAQPAELAYILARAETLVALDRPTEALALVKEKMQYFENSPTIRDAAGQLLVQQGKYAEAADVLRQANLLMPEDATIREHLALAYFQAGHYAEAGQLLARMVQDERFAKRGDLYTALGQCQMQLNNAGDARESFQVAVGLDPASVGAWLSLSRAAAQLNDQKRAEMSLRKAISLDPQSAEAQLMLGYLRLKQQKWDDALAAFKRSSALAPADTVSLCMIGLCLEKQGKGAEAIAFYAKALKMKPGDELAAKLMAAVQVEE